MARHTFLADMASWVMAIGAATTSQGGLAGDTALVIPAQTVTFWSASVGGMQYTDLLDVNGAAITSATSGTDGSLPQISGPDGVSVMWADASGGGGPRRLAMATDFAASKENALTPTTVITGTYTASPGNYVPVDISGGSVTITLPSAPADQSRIGVKLVATNTGATNTVTIQASGADTFNKGGGSTAATLSLLNQGIILQYTLATGIWYVQSDDLPLSAVKALSPQLIRPSGDTTGTTDVAAINAALMAGNPVNLTPGGTYYINSPIMPKTGSRIDGGMWWTASQNDNYSAGTGLSGGALIIMVPGFTGTAAISMVNTTTTQYYGVDISGITIEGNQIPSGTIYGIFVQGAWGACFLRGACIHRPPADCLRLVTDLTSGKIPDDWLIVQCKFSASRNGYGVYAAELADSWFTDCESSENALDGWYINYGVQTRWSNCKGENNGLNGFHFTGLGSYQAQWLTGCCTHLNTRNGFLFDDAGPSGGGSGAIYMLTGCVAQQDGQGSTTAGYAGFAASGCKEVVMGTGCIAQADSTGSYPQYGASQVSGSAGMCFTGSRLKTGAGVTRDDGSNTHALVNQSPVPF